MDYTQKIFLVGAGISISLPSGIPPAWPIIDIFCRWIAGGDKQEAKILRNCCSPMNKYNPFDFIRFESLIGAIEQIAPGTLNILRFLEEDGIPNSQHMFLAAAAEKGSRIITTNFDTRIETAAEWQDIELDTFVLSGKKRIPKKQNKLIKLHGSFPMNGKRRVLPRATLNRIGEIGLTFSHYKGFRKWFSKITQGATIYVLGYSASDSFDVVPLLEEYSRAKKIEWFDYNTASKRISIRRVSQGDPSPIPRSHTFDFVGITLERIKGLHPQADISRICGASLSHYLSYRFGNFFSEHEQSMIKLCKESQEDWHATVENNLQMLDDVLISNPLDKEAKNWLLYHIFHDGLFGEAMTRPEHLHSPNIPVNIDQLSDSKPTNNK